MGEQTGIDYTAVFAVARVLKMDATPDLLEQIRLLELGALTAIRGGDIETLLNG